MMICRRSVSACSFRLLAIFAFATSSSCAACVSRDDGGRGGGSGWRPAGAGLAPGFAPRARCRRCRPLSCAGAARLRAGAGRCRRWRGRRRRSPAARGAGSGGVGAAPRRSRHRRRRDGAMAPRFDRPAAALSPRFAEVRADARGDRRNRDDADADAPHPRRLRRGAQHLPMHRAAAAVGGCARCDASARCRCPTARRSASSAPRGITTVAASATP